MLKMLTNVLVSKILLIIDTFKTKEVFQWSKIKTKCTDLCALRPKIPYLKRVTVHFRL